MRLLLILLVAIGFATASDAGFRNRGGVVSQCFYGNNPYDGCVQLMQAGCPNPYSITGVTGCGIEAGLWTVNVIHSTTTGCAQPINAPCFFNTVARQSGQTQYYNMSGVVDTTGHPITWNAAGIDYPVGPWTPCNYVLDGVQAHCSAQAGTNLAGNPPQGFASCTYVAATQFAVGNVTCKVGPPLAGGAAITGQTGVYNGQQEFCQTSGTAITPDGNSYVWFSNVASALGTGSYGPLVWNYLLKSVDASGCTGVTGLVAAYVMQGWPQSSTVSGSIATTTLTLTQNPGQNLWVGETVNGSGVTATTITAILNQWNGTNAQYTVANSQNVGPVAITIAAAQYGSQNFYISHMATIQGYLFDDYYLGIQTNGNPALINVQDNYFLIGKNAGTANASLCKDQPGGGPIDFNLNSGNNNVNQIKYTLSNYMGYHPNGQCASDASTFKGGTQPFANSFNGAASVVSCTFTGQQTTTTLTETANPNNCWIGEGAWITGSGVTSEGIRESKTGLPICSCTGTGNNINGTYTTLTSQTINAGTTLTATYEALTVNSGATPFLNSYVYDPPTGGNTGFTTTSPLYVAQVVDIPTGAPFQILSGYVAAQAGDSPPCATAGACAQPTITGDNMSFGPVQSAVGMQVADAMAGGADVHEWNFANRWTSGYGTDMIGSSYINYNFIENRNLPAGHTDAIYYDEAGLNWDVGCTPGTNCPWGNTEGVVLPIQYEVEDGNTVLVDNTAANQETQYGTWSSTYAHGGLTGGVTLEAAAAYAASHFIVQFQYMEGDYNVIVVNKSTNGYLGTQDFMGGVSIYYNTHVGTYAGVITSGQNTNNWIDPIGSNENATGCISVATGVNTQPGSGTYAPALSKNINAENGNTITSTTGTCP